MLKKSLIILIFIIGCIWAIYSSLAAKYKYDVAQDYQYALETSQHIAISVQIKHDRFTFYSAQQWDTGFVKVNISATLTGYFAEPYV